MITTKTVKIERCEKVTSEYVEEKLKAQKLNVLRWAITGYDDKNFTISAAVIVE